jgi:hypothetical protein
MKKLIHNIFGDLFTSTAGTLLGIPTIMEGIEIASTDKATGILKITIGVSTLILGLISRIREGK